MINPNTMEQLNRFGFGSDIDALESYVASLQDAAGLGAALVDDSTYDGLVRILREVKPNSSVLNRNWEVIDNDYGQYDDILKEYGMCSITTLSGLDELGKFARTIDKIGHDVDLMASIKENGHGVRAVYAHGGLVSGSTRGRYKKGRDITRHLSKVLPSFISEWIDIPLVEIRGEMLVSIKNFEEHLKGKLKTPLSSVTSLMRDSVSDEEIELLNMVCYKVISDSPELQFNSLKEEFDALESIGLEVPLYSVIKGVNSFNLQSKVGQTLKTFELAMDKGMVDYSCDGIVFAINDNKDFYGAGRDGNAWNANFALKAGKYWKQNVYSGTILDVEFKCGKRYLVPKAIIDPVVTANGSEVRNVPLYNVGVMDRYGYVPGETVYFRYGGEQGVTLCDLYGNSIRE